MPGVSSITAAAAALGTPLAEGEQRVAILPATYGTADLARVLREFDTTVLLKVAGVLPEVVRTLEAEGQLDGAAYVARVTSDRQRIERDLRALEGERPDYLSLAIVHRHNPAETATGDATPQVVPYPTEPRRRPFALYALTPGGLRTSLRLQAELPDAQLFVTKRLLAEAPPGSLPLASPPALTLAETFGAFDHHVFMASVGLVVRMVAPYLRDKKTDPAVVCIDEAERFVVSTLSGHLGGANAAADRLAAILGATPVVTTASDALGTLAVDLLGREFGWQLETGDKMAVRAAAAVVAGAPVAVVQEAGEPDWWPADRPLPPGIARSARLEEIDPAAFEALLVITDRLVTVPEKALVYRPRSLVLGVGCDSGTPGELLGRGIRALLAQAGLAHASVRAIATLDRKGDEPGIQQLAADHGWAIVRFGAPELAAVPVPNPSERVRGHVGTPGVAEPAALLAAGARELVLTKRTYTEPGAGRSMTLSVARIPFERGVHV